MNNAISLSEHKEREESDSREHTNRLLDIQAKATAAAEAVVKISAAVRTACKVHCMYLTGDDALTRDCICTAFAMHVHCICTACALHVHCMCIACALHVLCMCTACALHVQVERTERQLAERQLTGEGSAIGTEHNIE